MLPVDQRESRVRQAFFRSLLVIKGQLLIKLRDREVRLGEGEFAIVPKGVEHLPIAEEGAHVLLIEPRSTLNTGNIIDSRTVANPEWV